MEFLIDNCLEIFGENIPAHSSSISDDSLEHTDSSGMGALLASRCIVCPVASVPGYEAGAAVTGHGLRVDSPGREG